MSRCDTGCRLGEDAKALLGAGRDKAARGRAAEAQADVASHMDFGRLGARWCAYPASA